MPSVEEQLKELGNPDAPLLIGDTLYPPLAKENAENCIAAIEANSTLGIKYKPRAHRLNILGNALIDGFIGRDDNPQKLVDFIDQLKIRRPELAVHLLDRILDDNKHIMFPELNASSPNNPANQNNRPAPIIIYNSPNTNTQQNFSPETQQNNQNPPAAPINPIMTPSDIIDVENRLDLPIET